MERKQKKLKKAPAVATSFAGINVQKNAKKGPLLSILSNKIQADFIDKKRQRSSSQFILNKFKDPYIEEEEREIKRLEKLLGISSKKEKSKVADKLNKEYAMYEGIDGNLGDFLQELDELNDLVEGKNKIGKKPVFSGLDDIVDDNMLKRELGSDGIALSSKPTNSRVHHHIIDDDEQEKSDLSDSDMGLDSDFDDKHSGEYSSDDEGFN